MTETRENIAESFSAVTAVNFSDSLSTEDKIRLVNGKGSWNTYDGNGEIPSFSMSDGPHGLRKQDFENYADLNKSNVATCFPSASCLASSWNRNNLSELGKALSREAKKEKVDVVLGPGINMKRSPLCGRNFEYFSEDPYLAGTLSAEYIKAIEKTGTGTSLKHFACNNQETRRQISNSIIDERTLNEIYLRAFEIAVKEGNPSTVMASYNRINGEYACASKMLLTDILRNRWKFKGIVISDWGACMNAGKCIKAGMDLAMPDSSGYYGNVLKKQLAEKTIELSDIEKADYRILSLAQSLAEKKKEADEESEAVNYEVQHETAYRLAADSAVLLKNEGMLPLKKKQIAVIGELAEFMKFQGGGSSHITTAEFPSAVDSLRNQGYEVLYAKGYYSSFCPLNKLEAKNIPLMENALKLAEKARRENIPLLFFTGLTEQYEGEGFDRTSLSLPEFQLKLLDEVLSITDDVAVVNFSGAPVVFPFRNKVKAILQMYLCGEAAGEACAELLSGKINPSGKLAETFPLKEEDVPCFKNFGLNDSNVEYREQLLIGYRHYETKNIPVQYEFGFGLSYTTFAYSNLSADEKEISVDVRNTGSEPGSEIVEVYVKNPAPENKEILRASVELRGFEKVFLEPGEVKKVTVKLDENAFKVFSTEKKDFVKVSGEYEILCGASVKDIRLSQKIKVEGEKLEEVCSPVSEDFYSSCRIEKHHAGNFDMGDCLGDIAAESKLCRKVMRIIENVLKAMTHVKSREDPAYKIQVSAVREGSMESLIVFAGSPKIEGFLHWLLKKANRKK